MRDVLSARSRLRNSRWKCQPTLWVIVLSLTAAINWLAVLTDELVRIAQAALARGRRGDHQIELIHLLPHLRRDHVAHRARVFPRRHGHDRIEFSFFFVQRQEPDDVLFGCRAVALDEFLDVAGRVDERPPLLHRADRQIQHRVEVDIDEPGHVLGRSM